MSDWPAGRLIQTARVDCGAFTASQQKDITVTWATAFADTNYTVITDLVETAGPTGNASAKRQILTRTASAITVRATSGSTGYSAGALFLHAIAIHD